MAEGDVIPFTNVNELPQVPKDCRREFVEIMGHWFYEDVRTIWDRIYG